MHPYYDSEKRIKSNERAVNIIGICLLLIAVTTCIPWFIKWENKQFDPEDYWIDYEVVVYNDNQITLFNTNNVNDSVALRLEYGGERFVGTDIIQIYDLKQRRPK